MKVLALFPSGSLLEQISTTLSSQQCVIEIVSSAKDCAQSAKLDEYDAILLDADPESYGDILILVRLLRHEPPNVALFVFDRQLDPEQRLQLFASGVDDCVHEPFFPAEFAFRLDVSIRLHQAAFNPDAPKRGTNVLRSGDLELDLVFRTVTRRGILISLRPKEFQLLQYLMRNVNRVVTRTMIMEHVWNSSFEGLTNVVDVYIGSLRGKLDRDFPQKLIQTTRGVGYMLASGVSGETGEQLMSERTYQRPGYGRAR